MEMEKRADCDEAEELRQVSPVADSMSIVGDGGDGNLFDKDYELDQEFDDKDKHTSMNEPTMLEIFSKRTPNKMFKERVLTEVDVIDDGFHWRKYGKKKIAKSPYPRNYYRCAGIGCPVMKHVERSHEDPKYLEITYSGSHICRRQTSSVANFLSLNPLHSQESVDKSKQQQQELCHHQQSGESLNVNDPPAATQAGIDLVAKGDKWHVEHEFAKPKEKDEEDFTPIFEEDDEQNVELWHGLVGYHEAFLPKKGDLVVYFPQGHLEYADLFRSLKQSSVVEAPSFGLQPEVVCRVVHVQLIANKKNAEVCADVTLLPESTLVGMSSERKENEDLGIDVTKFGEMYSKPASGIFSKTLEIGDADTLSVPKQNGNLIFQDYVQLDSPKEVVARDFQGTEWLLELSLEDKTSNYCITKGWSEFVSDKHLVPGDKVVLLRDQEKKLRLGIRRAGIHEIGVPDSIIAKNYNSYNFLLPVADAISLMSKFHVFYCTRASFVNFLIPYDKYMKSIRKTWPIKDSFEVKMSGSMQRCRGIVNNRADFDPNKWPQSSWRCLVIRWEKHTGERFMTRVSPWEMDCGVSSISSLVGTPLHLKNASDVCFVSPTIPIAQPFKKPGRMIKLVPATLYTFGLDRLQEAVETLTGVSSTRYSLPGIPYEQQEERKPFIFSEYQNTSRSAVIEFLESFRYHKAFKISQCVDGQIQLDPAIHSSLESLEFDSCIFNSPILQVNFPLSLKELKITNCVNPGHILTLLIDQKDIFLESLSIDGCSTLLSLPIDKLPSTIRRLKIINCQHLKSLDELVHTGSHDSAGLVQLGDANLGKVKSTSCSGLKHLVICDCPELEFFPESRHTFNCLELLLVSSCSSLISFLERGLPSNSLIAFLLYECESLRFLPKNLHEITSLHFLNINDCPSLRSFPKGGLPPNLVSLSVTDCENLVHLSQWGLHKLKSLRSCTVAGGHLTLGQK